jgi:hypothetical protein
MRKRSPYWDKDGDFKGYGACVFCGVTGPTVRFIPTPVSKRGWCCEDCRYSVVGYRVISDMYRSFAAKAKTERAANAPNAGASWQALIAEKNKRSA